MSYHYEGVFRGKTLKTTAPTKRKAKSNLAFRFRYEFPGTPLKEIYTSIKVRPAVMPVRHTPEVRKSEPTFSQLVLL